MDLFVARQAIVDRQRRLYGYELLYRSDAIRNAFDGTNASDATMQVLSNVLTSVGVDKLLDGKKAFVNFDDRLLSQELHRTMPPESIVIELLETLTPTNELLSLCQSIQKQGYAIALDDFTGQPEFESLAKIANIIKVDIQLTSRNQQRSLVDTYKPLGVRMLAEKVENYREFEWARLAGYDLFQGYFFARPEIVRKQQIPAIAAKCLEIIHEVQKADLDFKRLEQLIGGDLSLTYKLMRYANSALFGRLAKIRSINRALLTLGADNIRRWATLATLTMLATDKPNELVKLSLVRAKFCKNLAGLTVSGSHDAAFLMGMFSLLDALIDQPLTEALQMLGLEEAITDALLGIASPDALLPRLYRLVRSYELGEWGEVERLGKILRIEPQSVTNAYIDSAVWAEQVAQAFDTSRT